MIEKKPVHVQQKKSKRKGPAAGCTNVSITLECVIKYH